MPVASPAIEQFASLIGSELLFVQVLIRPEGSGGFELCHGDDQHIPRETLKMLAQDNSRLLAMHTPDGIFRPLKCAPSLARGWRMLVKNADELELVLSRIYPGTVADWYAVHTGPPPVTHYRTMAERQSGMFRATASLTDSKAADVILNICSPANCLKQRLWTVTGLPPDSIETKSLAPCLEPCAILIESARKAAPRREV